MPIFSGNIDCYLVNQLCEFELTSKVKNVMSKQDTNKVNLSSVYAYYTHLTEVANMKFSEAAMQLAADLRNMVTDGDTQ